MWEVINLCLVALVVVFLVLAIKEDLIGQEDRCMGFAICSYIMLVVLVVSSAALYLLAPLWG